MRTPWSVVVVVVVVVVAVALAACEVSPSPRSAADPLRRADALVDEACRCATAPCASAAVATLRDLAMTAEVTGPLAVAVTDRLERAYVCAHALGVAELELPSPPSAESDASAAR